MLSLTSILLLTIISPFLSAAVLLLRSIAERSDREYTIDEYFAYKSRQRKRRKRALSLAPDRIDEYAVIVRPDLLVDDAVGLEVDRRFGLRGTS